MQDLGQASDVALIARVADGDRAAFEAIVRRHGPSLRRFARALTSESSADDVLQESLLDAFRHARGFRGEGSVRGWLFTLTRHRAFHHRARERALRDGARERALRDGARDRALRDGAHDRATVAVESPLLELGIDAGFGCARVDAFEAIERRDAVTVALARLSPEEREILLLRDVEGLSGDEAASVLGVALPAMKSRLHRARLRLMAALRETGGFDVE